MSESKRNVFQLRLQPEQVIALDYLKNKCAYNPSELVRQFIIQLYEKELTKRGLA